MIRSLQLQVSELLSAKDPINQVVYTCEVNCYGAVKLRSSLYIVHE